MYHVGQGPVAQRVVSLAREFLPDAVRLPHRLTDVWPALTLCPPRYCHRKRLPIAIWPDRWYDKDAIWTFSATLVDGVPTIVYPGIAGPNASLGDCGHGPTGQGCFTHAVALPGNLSDPWLEDWTKPPYNPIVSNGIDISSRDPSTAWQTKKGEWRYMDAKADVYTSLDFKRWQLAGNLPEFGTGDCPDFYPLPSSCSGCDHANADAAADEGIPQGPPPTPSHVRAGGFQGVYTLGNYQDGKPGSTGSWTPDAAVSAVALDQGGPDSYYAAKSFFDGKRRIVVGWIKLSGQVLEAVDESGKSYKGFRPGGCPGLGAVMTNTNSLPREVTYDPALGLLLFHPVEELSALRGPVLGTVRDVQVDGEVALTRSSSLKQSEVRVSFDVPTEPVRLGLKVLGGAGTSAGTNFSTTLFFDFTPAPGTSGKAGPAASTVWNVTVGFNQSSMLCPHYVPKGPPPSLKDRVPCPSGTASISLKPSDSTLEIAVWIDNVVMEVFFMGGRIAWTVPLPCQAVVHGSGAAVFAHGAAGPVTVQSATAWAMEDISYEDLSGDPDNQT